MARHTANEKSKAIRFSSASKRRDERTRTGCMGRRREGGGRKRKRAKEEEGEDIKPYLRLARFRVGERRQLRCEEQPMSEVAAALTSVRGPVRAPRSPLLPPPRRCRGSWSVPRILRDTFVRAAASPRTVFPVVLAQKERVKGEGAGTADGRGGGRKGERERGEESSSGAATCGLAFLSRRPEPALRGVP